MMEYKSPTFTSDIIVEEMSVVASDAMVVSAARVSTQGQEGTWDDDESEGLVRYLMKNRHGTPFEHNHFTFRVHAPIFVFREFHRHRIGWSYNEESGRYKEMDGVFYIPKKNRKIVQEGKPGHYFYMEGTEQQVADMQTRHQMVARLAYQQYQELLAAGVAREVARMTLPLNLYSTMYATCNARSIMAFLSLRTEREDATFPSHPMWEIQVVAQQIEGYFQQAMPGTWAAFNDNGRVCP